MHYLICKTNDMDEPNLDFYNFEIYNLKEPNAKANKNRTNKPVVVLLQNLKKEEIIFLRKIFQAVGLDLDKEVSILEYPQYTSYKEIAAEFELQKLVIFGLEPREIGLNLNVKLHQLVEFQEAKILFSYTLDTIANTLAVKKQFWAQLQMMFAK